MTPKSLTELQKYLQNKNLDFHVVSTEEAENPTDVGVVLKPQPGLEQLYAELIQNYSQTGWWPVQTEGLRGDLERPWIDGELREGDEIGTARQFFETHMDDGLEHEDEEYAAEAEFPPYTRQLRQQILDNLDRSFTDRLATIEPELLENNGLLVVPTPRPADIPGIVGWLGSCNFDFSGGDISAVLRGWEDRFGAVLYKLDFDLLCVQLDVTDLPEDVIRLIGLEHYIFCPDNIDQGSGSYEAYLEDVEQPTWDFWWD